MGKGTKKKTVWRSFSFGDDVTKATKTKFGNADSMISSNNMNRRDSTSSEGQENIYHLPNESSTNGAWNQQRYRNTNKVGYNYNNIYNNNNNSNHNNNNNNNHNNNNNNNNNYRLNNKNGNSSHAYYHSNLSASRIEYQRMDNDYDNRISAEHINNDNISNTYYKRSSDKHFSDFTTYSMNGGNEANATSDGSSSGHGNFRRRPYTQLSSSTAHYKNKSFNHYQSHGVLTNSNRRPVRNHYYSSNIFNSLTKPNENGAENTQNIENGGVNDEEKDNKSTTQTQHHFKEDEYTRITTPRSDVLFKKGYLSRPKRSEMTSPAQTATTSSNGSAAVSVISGDETTPYYPMQSKSPENCNTFASSPNYLVDGYDQDLPLMYSSGFYDGNGFFYVNPFVQNRFDQYNGPTILMPYGSPPLIEPMKARESPYSTLSSTSPPTPIEEKSVAFTEQKSDDSDEVLAGTISETGSINHDSTTPDYPSEPTEESFETPASEISISNDINDKNAEERSVNDEQTKTVTDEIPLTEEEAVVDDSELSYYQPLIFVPQIPMMSIDGQSNCGGRHSTFGNPRYFNNRYGQSQYFGRYRKRRRFWNRPNFYQTQPFSCEPDEGVAPETDFQSNDTDAEQDTNELPNKEQCDKIFEGTKINANVNEFVPRNPRMLFIPLTFPPSFPLELPSVMLPLPPTMIPATESSLNADVPEFHPRNYVPKVIQSDADAVEEKHIDECCIEKNASILTESNATSTEMCNGTNAYDPKDLPNAVELISDLKSKHTRTDTGKKNSQINSKADLDDKHPNNVTSKYTGSNNKNSDRNRLGDSNSNSNSNGKINSTKKINDTIDKKEKANSANTTVSYSAKSNEIFAKAKKVSANSEKTENAERTYAQMLTVIDAKSNSSATIQAESQKRSYSEKPTGVNANSIKPKNKLKTNRPSTMATKFPIITVDNTLPTLTVGEPVRSKYRKKNASSQKSDGEQCTHGGVEDVTVATVAPEWHTVRSKCRKKNASNKEIDFEIITFGTEEDMAADQALIHPNEMHKNTEVTDNNFTSASTEAKALVDVPKNSKQSTKTKRKSSSKKVQRKATIETFNIIEPDFSENIDSNQCVKHEDENDTDDAPLISPNEVILDPIMFASSVPLLVHTPMSSAPTLRRQAVKAGLVGLNKCTLHLRQQFEIFQHDSDSENLLLRKEEEMVIRVLEQLNMSDKCENADVEPHDSIEIEKPLHSLSVENTLLDTEAAVWDADRFSINAKPYQNSYSSNHFLDHFFGDNDDKRKDSDDLRSSPSTEITVAQSLQDDDSGTPEKSDVDKFFVECAQECVDSGRDSIDGEPNAGHLDHFYLINNLKKSIMANLNEARENEFPDSAQGTMNEPIEAINEIEAESNQSDASVDAHLRIVDTKMLEQRKKFQQTFPITAAVSHWLNQARKEKTPDPILRIPTAQFDDRFFLSTVAVRVKHDSQENTDVDCYSTDDSVSINNDENQSRKYFHLPLSIDGRKKEYFDSDDVDDEEYDDVSLNFWESPSPTPPTFNSVYGTSTDYEHLFADKNEFLCNNIVNFDANHGNRGDVTNTKSDQMNATAKKNDTAIAGNNNLTKSPEACCIIM